VKVRTFDVRFQGINGLGPIGACLIRAGLFIFQKKLHKSLFDKAFLHSWSVEKITGRQDHTTSPSASKRPPTPGASQRLTNELLFQSAVQTYLWALPELNMYAMKEGSEKVFGKGYNVLPIWKERLNAKTLITTANSDVICAMRMALDFLNGHSVGI
jgi:hypothetical protein